LPDGSQVFETKLRGARHEPESLGEAAARTLLAQAPDGFFAA